MNWIPKLCFGYGVVASIAALIWHLLAIAGYDVLETYFWGAFPCLILYIIVMLLTFYQKPFPPFWAPVLMVSPVRIRIARMLLFVAGIDFLVCSMILISANRNASLDTINSVLSSMFLINHIYIAIHWGFRPENLFSPATLVFFSNPIHYMISPRRRAEARRRKR